MQFEAQAFIFADTTALCLLAVEKLLFAVVSCLFFANLASPQDSSIPAIPWPDRQVWPESPRAAQLRRVMMPTPGLLTGAVEFEIPVYTIEAEGVSIPVALKYRSNGIKVDDDPQPVGYGWTLTPALRVTRRIMGRPDGFFPFSIDFPEEQDDENGFYNKCFRSVTMIDAGGRDVIGGRPDKPYMDRFDTEHDIFTFYLPDKTLTMAFDKGKFVGVDCDEYKFENDAQLTYIHVTDPRGVKYVFDIDGECISGTFLVSEFLLSKIILPSGNTIVVTWIRNNHDDRGLWRVAPRAFIIDKESAPNTQYETESVDGELINPAHFDYTHDLSSITFPGGRADFVYDRDNMLSSINVFVPYSHDVVNADFNYVKSDRQEGMLLSRVEINGQTYSFEYNQYGHETHPNADWWGFYNGRNTDDCRSPKVQFKKGNEYDQAIYDFETTGVDRSVNESLIRSNLLKKAVYPTGAIAEWEYEIHRFPEVTGEDYYTRRCIEQTTLARGGGLRVKSVTLKNGENDTNPQIHQYIYGDNGDGLAVCTAAPILSTFISKTQFLDFWDVSLGDGYVTIFPQQITINSTSDYMTGQIGMPDIWYDCVTEVCDEGKTEYRFQNLLPDNVVYREWGHSEPTTIHTAFSKGPQLTSKTVYKKDSGGYTPVEKETLRYNNTSGNPNCLMSIAVRRLKFQYIDDTYSPDFGEEPVVDLKVDCRVYRNSHIPWFKLHSYGLMLQTEKYIGKTTTTYTDNGAIERTERVEYIPGTELVARRTVSDGCDSIINTYTYPSGNNGSTERLMVSKNVIGAPVEVATSYRGVSQGYRLDMRRRGNAAVFRPIRIATFTDEAGKRVWRNGNDYTYDSRGNITSSTDSAGVVTRWTWHNVCAYPLTMSLGPADRALTSSASWKTLVGVKSLTSPIGLRLLFDYDSDGRLIKQRQQDRNGREKIIAGHFYRINSDGRNFTATETYTDISQTVRNEVRYDFLGRPWGEFDNIGRLKATTLIEYDAMDRECARWMPSSIASSTVPETFDEALELVKDRLGDDCGYAITEYEASPRNLAVASVKAGSLWHSSGRKATVAMLTNDRGKHKCTRYGITADGVEALGLYAPGLLTVSVATDEDGVTAETYTDLRGLTVAIVKGGETTAYVYDDLGRMRYVLPPGLSGTHRRTDKDMQALAFIYDYDAYGRCISKKLPGIRPARYLYDAAGRLAAEKSANHSGDSRRIYGYDAYGRQVITLDCDITDDEAAGFASECRTASLGRDGYEYDRGGYAFEPEWQYPCKVVTATYYDDYSFKSIRSLGSEYDFDDGHPDEADVGHLSAAPGLVTGIYTGVGYEVIYYDDEGREIRRCGGRRGYNRGRTSTEYNYTGQPLAVRHRPDDDNGLRIDMDYDYDIDGRLHESATRLSQGASDSDRKQSEVATAWYQYDHVGRIESVTLGKTITRSFTYDIHGWLTGIDTGISSTLGGTPHRTFAETLRYADGRYPAYNGNISSKTTADGTYDYRYDTLNRLTDARFSAAAGKSHNYSASYGYDCRTNLTSIRRRGLYDRDASGNEEYDEVDDISISLDGNRAVSVDNYGEGAKFEDMVGSPSLVGMALTYDDAGRLRSDETRGIVRIDYNNDGLPTRVWFADGHSQLDSYDGLGRRLSTACYEAVTPVVAGKIPSRSRLVSTRYYYGDGTVCQGDSVIMTRFDGGYFDASGRAHYELADYQGNITDVVDSRGNIVSHTGYYPYGQPWRRPADMQRLYGGKEWLGADGRDEYDFHARRHAPHLARFTTPDPMAEATYWISPYAYCGGNPIRYTDPSGMKFTDRSWVIIQSFIERCEFDLIEQFEDGVKALKAAQVNGGSLDEAKAHFDKVNEYAAILGEITELKESDTEYDIDIGLKHCKIGEPLRGGTSYNTIKDRVEIVVPTKDLYILAHELKHAYQFEKGTISLGSSFKDGTPFYDQIDEMEAVLRGELFGGPKWDDEKEQYSHLQPGPNGVSDYTKSPNSEIYFDKFFKQLSRVSRSAFKWNNTIYNKGN